jgi:hypothetical protein
VSSRVQRPGKEILLDHVQGRIPGDPVDLVVAFEHEVYENSTGPSSCPDADLAERAVEIGAFGFLGQPRGRTVPVAGCGCGAWRAAPRSVA